MRWRSAILELGAKGARGRVERLDVGYMQGCYVFRYEIGSRVWKNYGNQWPNPSCRVFPQLGVGWLLRLAVGRSGWDQALTLSRAGSIVCPTPAANCVQQYSTKSATVIRLPQIKVFPSICLSSQASPSWAEAFNPSAASGKHRLLFLNMSIPSPNWNPSYMLPVIFCSIRRFHIRASALSWAFVPIRAGVG